jgi:diacylglycerol kinase (ATP)
MIKAEFLRLCRAARYSAQGLLVAWRDAGAFRTEVLVTPILVAAAFHYAENNVQLALLIGSWVVVPMAELLNTGIEAAVDLCTREQHPLAKKAKDTASAGVFMAMVLCAVVWACIII